MSKIVVQDQYKVIVSRMCNESCREHVIQAVASRISIARRRSIRSRLALFGTFGVVALIGLKPAFDLFYASALRTGFLDYISLLSSGSVSFFSTWRDYMMTLAESLPIMEISILTCLVLFLAYSARRFAITYTSLSFNKDLRFA